MIVEKLDWLRHAGLQIFSLDIQPDGSRFATAGGDHKVRIWSITALQTVEHGVLQPRLLATLRDHFGSVNCVRWAEGGHLIASGSDDQLVIVHKRHPGSGRTEFGSGEAPDVENWKNILTLRGHSADVVDIGWSPDDSMIASCSLDNTVRIWSVVNGNLISILQGHQSLVKGVAWDPVGFFLASQSDDKSVIIWQTGKWNAVHKAEGPWEKTVGSTFFRRLAWSPCGHFITTTHGFQEPSHTAPVLERGEWCTSFDFVGHNAPVVAVRYNHSMFRRLPSCDPRKAPQDNHVAVDDQSTIADDAPYNVVAMGSQDCNITVWTTASPRPVFVGKHFFSQSVVDLSWSTDGYTLLCCSVDGTVATFTFESKELGLKVSKEEMEEFKRARYGDLQVHRLKLVDSPDQSMPDYGGAKQHGNCNAVAEVQAAVRELPLDVPPPYSANDRRMHVLQQTEYRGPDGRRRIIPKPLEQEYKENEPPDGMRGTINDSFSGPPGSNSLPTNVLRSESKGRAAVDISVPAVRQMNGRESQPVDTQTRTHDLGPFAGGNMTCCGKSHSKYLLDPPTSSDKVLTIEVQSSQNAPFSLEARPSSVPQTRSPQGAPHTTNLETDIICSQEGMVLWRDRLLRPATLLSGNSNFWVVACEGNVVQVYTAAGRRALPPIILTSPVAFMCCDNDWKLLLLSCCGALNIWDLRSCVSVLRDSISAVLSSYPQTPREDAVKFRSAKISDAGAPLIVLENQHVFLFHLELQCWLRVADSAQGSSELGLNRPITTGLKKDPEQERCRPSNDSFDGSQAHSPSEKEECGRLESKLAIAAAIRSPSEYRDCLITYVKCLTKCAEISKLRELCEEMFGPRHALTDGEEPGLTQLWNPLILGMEKRDILKRDVLPNMELNESARAIHSEYLASLAASDSKLEAARS